MKNTIDYAGLQGEVKVAQAIQDTKDYLGGAMWEKLMDYVALCTTQNDVEFGCSFVGVQGYPARAIYQRYVEGRGDKDFMEGQFKEDGH